MGHTNKLLIICGPTATGKTRIAVMFAKLFGGELISADSRQVYRGMDIGTGKDKDQIDVPVHLLDVVNPDQEFSVSHWTKLAFASVDDIQSRGKLPIVVGGTGLYIRSLLHPPQTINIPPDNQLRRQLEGKSVSELQSLIDSTVLQAMNRSDRFNPRRLIRKIEISKAGKTGQIPQKAFDCLVIGLTAPMPFLFQRIDERVEDRIRQGMEDEVRSLEKRYGRENPAMSAIGYRSRLTWKQDEHNYAKRQLTWFKKQDNIRWFDVSDQHATSQMTEYVRSWYTRKANEYAD